MIRGRPTNLAKISGPSDARRRPANSSVAASASIVGSDVACSTPEQMAFSATRILRYEFIASQPLCNFSRGTQSGWLDQRF